MARVRWGTRCKGFHSKEGPIGLHYCIEQSARNPLECNQVPRALGESSRSCPQTSNNQPWFTSLEISWGFLAQAVLHWLSGGLCHMRKCQGWGYYVRRKGMICDCPMDVCMRNLWQKAEQGKKTGTNSSTSSHKLLASRKCVMRAKNKGAHIQHSTLE